MSEEKKKKNELRLRLRGTDGKLYTLVFSGLKLHDPKASAGDKEATAPMPQPDLDKPAEKPVKPWGFGGARTDAPSLLSTDYCTHIRMKDKTRRR